MAGRLIEKKIEIVTNNFDGGRQNGGPSKFPSQLLIKFQIYEPHFGIFLITEEYIYIS